MNLLGWDEKNHIAMGGTSDGYVFVQIEPPNSDALPSHEECAK